MDFNSLQLQIFGNAKILRSRLNSRLDLRESENISRELVEYVTGEPYVTFLMDPSRTFTSKQLKVWTSAVDRLLLGEPLQYILERAHFGGLEFKVGPGVLIPRPETEELVVWIEEWANAKINSGELSSPKVIDIGTGSGCIAIHLAKNIPAAEVHAVDISPEALELATYNANHLDAAVQFHQTDILDEKTLSGLPHSFDIIVSNPPYIPYIELEEMSASVTHFEPQQALFVPDEDPLLFYRCIANWSVKSLAAGGALFFEIHESKGEDIINMLRDIPFRNLERRLDLQGKVRMVAAFA